MDEVKRVAPGFQAHVAQRRQGDRDLRTACNNFESLVMHELLKSMRRTVEKCELFHGGQGEEVYESLLDMELAKEMSGLGPNSLAEMLYRQLSPEKSENRCQNSGLEAGQETQPDPPQRPSGRLTSRR